MSDVAFGWLLGGWSFGRSPDEIRVGRVRATRPDDRETGVGAGETDDDHLVAQVRAGDAAAFETLFQRFHPSLVRFAASYVGSIEAGEEVVSDVFLRLWKHRTTWVTTDSVSAYLFGAVRNRAFDVVRRRSREDRRMTMFRDVGEAPGTAVPPLGLAEQVERDDYTAVFLRLMSKLPERRRLILSLRWSHGLAWNEIAAVLGMTSPAVQMEHSRILAHLRAALRAL